LEHLFRAGEPAVAVRGVHLDLKGTPPTPRRLLGLLELFAACRYNAVLVEWEDTFPWTVDERFRCETAYSPEEVAGFHAAAEKLGLEVIPLVQCLGHMETPLSVGGYEHLREVPHQEDVLNPLAPGARELVQKMVEDVLAATPALRHFHLGGDEAWSFGTHPDTKAYVEAHGRAALYLQHVEPMLEALNGRGVRPILWHDMMQQWDADALGRLAARADLCVWGYSGHPDRTTGHHSWKVIERFADHGVPLWGATAYKGAGGHDTDLTDHHVHTDNALGWAEVAPRYGLKGVFATAWSRYSTHNVCCETVEASLDSLVNVAVILHDARPPDGGVEACVEALGQVGEKQRFQASRAAMAKLAEAREHGWRQVRHLRQLIATAAGDARRRPNSRMVQALRRLRAAVAQAEAAADVARQAYADLIPPIWVGRYLDERIAPLREELDALEPRARRLDAAGCAGALDG
jgi:hexosaminidase